MTPEVNNMADEQQPPPVQATEADLVKQQMIKTAHEQVTQAMDQAMAELPSRLSPQKENANSSESKADEVKPKPKSLPPLAPPAEDIEYVEPMQDPYGRAIKYLEQHNVMQMFQQLTASIVFNKPDKPLDFMMGEVVKMKKVRDAEKQESS